MQFVKENFLAEPVWFPLKVLLLQIFFLGRHITLSVDGSNSSLVIIFFYYKNFNFLDCG